MMGPLRGVRVIEIVGLGPGPFAAMMLADMGADVLRIDRPSAARSPSAQSYDFMARGRASVGIDLKHSEGARLALELIAKSDALIEGFRPGVMERLGLGPDVCHAASPRLVYGRMTGWGQDGPLAPRAGHDINYAALSGALHAVGRAGDNPVPPLNLIADFGGGGMLLAFGVLCALLEAKTSGHGQVVDAAMLEGASLMMTMFHGMQAAGYWKEERGTNLLDSGAHFYETYATSDDKYMAVGAIEPAFYATLLMKLELDASTLPTQMDRRAWPQMKQRFAAVFRTKTQLEWRERFDGTDACVTPVLSMHDAILHPHNIARGNFVTIAGSPQPAPAPRFSRTPPSTPAAPSPPCADTASALTAWGMDATRLDSLRAQRVIA